MNQHAYTHELEKLREELLVVQRWLIRSNNRLMVLLEGRDTAGKGSTVHAITRRLNPRYVRTVALTKPTEKELSQWYFQRYIQHLPSAGELVLFDRSWYNRAGVESVMGFATPEQVQSFLETTPAFESMLVRDGIILRKYWLSCDQKEQEERFHERATNPLKRYKLSPTDIASREKYRDYTKARDRMFAATHTHDSPWYVVDYNSQKRGRLNLIRHLIQSLPYDKAEAPEIDLSPLPDKLRDPELREPWTPIKNHYKK